MRSYPRAYFSACLVIGVLACERTEPTGLPSSRAGAPAGEQAVYPEERPFWNLAQTLPGSAGFFIDTASGNVVVSLTDLRRPEAAQGALRSRLAPELARARAKHPQADVVSRPVAYTFLQLKEWRDRLNGEVFAIPGVVWLDLDEVRNRVVIGLEASADRGAIRRLAGGLTVPDAALDFETDGPVVLEAGLTDQIRPIAGGTKIQRVQSGVTVTCTLGFPGLWNGARAFVTASHCSRTTLAVDSTRQYQPTAPLTHADSLAIAPIGFEVADYSEPCPPKLGSACAWADAAVYQFTGPTAQWTAGRIARPTYGCFPGPCSPVNLQIGGYFRIAATDSSLVVGDLISMIGSGTGWSQSYVQKTCTNVKLNTTQVAECQDYGSYGNGNGDSGGPILLNISPSDSNVVLGGIHWGRTGQYAVFSPWSGIARQYPGLVVQAQGAGNTVPATAPDTVPDWIYDDSNLVALPEWYEAGLFIRDVVGVVFRPGTPVADRQAAVDRVSGTVLGGMRPRIGEGIYVVRLPHDSTNSRAFEAVDTLASTPAVLAAVPGMVLIDPFAYRRPNDGAGWKKGNWHLDPAAAYGSGRQTWGLEAVSAPLAWGCTIGDFDTRVGVIDAGFHMIDDLRPNIGDGSSLDLAGENAATHGTEVSSVLAASGNDSVGMAGMMWRADLRPYDVILRTRGGRARFRNGLPMVDPNRVSIALTDLANADARVINMSVGVRYSGSGTRTAKSDQVTAEIVALYADAIRIFAPGKHPLIVIAAGNNAGQDAYWSLFPNIKDSLPDLTVVVTAAGVSLGQLWQGTGGQGSSVGSLVDVAAPGENIGVMNQNQSTAITKSGTSLAAPLVSGIAGLLYSFDPTLSVDSVRKFILAGAARGGQGAGSYLVVNAYESVKLAAQRAGMPLCGNRVWVSNDTVFAERDTAAHTTERLVTLGGQRGNIVNARHGGHRFDVYTSVSGNLVFALQPGGWQQTLWDDTLDAPSGTYYSWYQTSHDLDSAVVFSSSGDGVFQINLRDVHTGAQKLLKTLSVPLSGWTGSTCIALSRPDSTGNRTCSQYAGTGSSEHAKLTLAYSPRGDEVVAAVTRRLMQSTGTSGFQPCPGSDPADPTPALCQSVSYRDDSQRTEVHLIRIPDGVETALWSILGKDVFWLGVSEDDGQVVNGEAAVTQTSTFTGSQNFADPPRYTNCGVSYRAYRLGTEVRPFIATAADMCADIGRGTITPAPRRNATGR